MLLHLGSFITLRPSTPSASLDLKVPRVLKNSVLSHFQFAQRFYLNTIYLEKLYDSIMLSLARSSRRIFGRLFSPFEK